MKVGILGAGNIAVKMAAAINGLGEDYDAYAVASRNLIRAEKFAQVNNIQKAYGSYEDMLADEEVDLVYIATPHAMHYEHAMMCLKHNKPVLCEKAFTENARQARELIEYAESHHIFITEAIWTRYMPSRKMLDNLLREGVIGKATSLSANLGYALEHKERMRKPELAGGALLDLGVYPLNFASMVFGDDVECITGDCVKLETGVDCQESITLRYEDGKVASLYATMLAITDRRGVIYGDKGFIQVENINNCESIYVYNNRYEMVEQIAIPKQINGYEYEVIACKEALDNGRLECEEMPHSETIRMMEWMDLLREKWNVEFPGE